MKRFCEECWHFPNSRQKEKKLDIFVWKLTCQLCSLLINYSNKKFVIKMFWNQLSYNCLWLVDIIWHIVAIICHLIGWVILWDWVTGSLWWKIVLEVSFRGSIFKFYDAMIGGFFVETLHQLPPYSTSKC